MKKYLIFLTIIFFLLSLLVLFKFYKRSQTSPLVTPFFREDISPVLKKSLEKASLNLETAPTVLGDTITASVSGFRIIFSKNSDLETQVRALQLVLGGLKMDDKTVSEIDLRFNKVIVRH